tara:strand:+ start:630 stop:872 length:243 start_codon:yes stop_codon:yes gene_type:complete
MSNETTIKRDIKQPTINELVRVQSLIKNGETHKADLYLSSIIDDLSSSMVTVNYERETENSKMNIPVCRSTEDLVAYNID